MEEKKYEVITLEDGIDYIVYQEIDNYVLLVNPDDQTDFCIRKNVIKDGQEYIESLDNEDEFDKAAVLFAKYINN